MNKLFENENENDNNDEMLNDLSNEDLYDELEKFNGKNVTVSIINGFSGVVFLDGFDFGVCNDCDGEDQLFLNTYGEVGYSIKADEISNAYKDNFINQIFVVLDNGQVLQIWTED